MNLSDEIRKQIEKNKELKLAVGEINNHLSTLENLVRNDIIDQVDEACQRGLEDGKKAFDLLGAERDSEYRRGLSEGNDIGYKDGVKDGQNEAWECARELYLNGACKDRFGEYFNTFIKNHTAQEAIERLKAYEEKQKADNKIEVGDEVNWSCNCFIVTRIFQPRNGKEQCDGIDDDGCVYHDVLMDDLEKTGRHFDIASILEDMRND
jgi:hypothetical protein